MQQPSITPTHSIGKQLLAGLGLFLATTAWASSFIVIKDAIAAIPVPYYLFFRFLTGFLTLLLCCLPKLKQIDKGLIKAGFWIGLTLTAAYTTQTLGLERSSVGNAAFITSVYVIFVPFFGWFFTHKLDMMQVGVAVVTLAGLAVFAFDPHSSGDLIGDLLVLIAACCYGLQVVLVGRYTRKYDSMLLTLVPIGFTMLMIGVIALISTPIPPAADFTVNVWLAILYCGVVCTALCYFLQTATQRILHPVQASVIMTMQGPIGAVFGWIFLHEVFTTRQYFGAAILLACMIVAVALPHWQEKRQAAKMIDRGEETAL